jgi:single-strand DNA-binding protein
MSVRSLNKVMLIGNLTRDPELRYTPNGAAVCTMGLATNRSWTTDTGEKKDDVEYHRLVAWNKLAELCSQLLTKGRKIYTEGRLQTRTYTGQDGVQRSTTEIVMDDMIILDPKSAAGGSSTYQTPSQEPASASSEEVVEEEPKAKQQEKPAKSKTPAQLTEEVNVDDIPF